MTDWLLRQMPEMLARYEYVRKFAAEQKLTENEALEVGLKEKAKEFLN